MCLVREFVGVFLMQDNHRKDCNGLKQNSKVDFPSIHLKNLASMAFFYFTFKELQSIIFCSSLKQQWMQFMFSKTETQAWRSCFVWLCNRSESQLCEHKSVWSWGFPQKLCSGVCCKQTPSLHVVDAVVTNCTFITQAQSLVSDELIGRKAVVQLNHINVAWLQTRSFKALFGRQAGHVVSNLQPRSWTLHQQRWAVEFVLSLQLTILMQLFSENVEERSVTISWATISTAWPSSWCVLTKSSLAKTAAPAPSEVGLVSEEEKKDYILLYYNFTFHLNM